MQKKGTTIQIPFGIMYRIISFFKLLWFTKSCPPHSGVEIRKYNTVLANVMVATMKASSTARPDLPLICWKQKKVFKIQEILIYIDTTKYFKLTVCKTHSLIISIILLLGCLKQSNHKMVSTLLLPIMFCVLGLSVEVVWSVFGWNSIASIKIERSG